MLRKVNLFFDNISISSDFMESQRLKGKAMKGQHNILESKWPIRNADIACASFNHSLKRPRTAFLNEPLLIFTPFTWTNAALP